MQSDKGILSMKNEIIYSLVIPAILCLTSCTDNPVNKNISDNLEGTWVYRSYENDVYTMEKSFQLEKDNSGIVILGNRKLIERKNVGFCGTPPVVYDNYEGNWESISDKVLRINVEYWGGTENYTMEIVSVTNSILKFKKVMIK
jgi:hypothetical protein